MCEGDAVCWDQTRYGLHGAFRIVRFMDYNAPDGKRPAPGAMHVPWSALMEPE